MPRNYTAPSHAAIAETGAAGIKDMGKVIGKLKAKYTGQMDFSKASGLVKVGIEGWRRSRMLEITKKGEAQLAKALPLWERAQKTLREKLGDRDWATVNGSLDRLLSASRK